MMHFLGNNKTKQKHHILLKEYYITNPTENNAKTQILYPKRSSGSRRYKSQHEKQSRGLAERGQEEEEENEQHWGYILCLGYLATID